MRVERIGNDKIKIFLTFDDLKDRGIKKEDLWSDVPKVHDLFNDIMEEAYDQLGFELSGPVAVEIFALPAQGMVVIVTRGENSLLDEEDEDNLYDLEVTLEETDSIIFAFKDFEDMINAVKRVNQYLIYGGQLFYYKDHYLLVFDHLDVVEKEVDRFISLLSEYGEASSISNVILEEYGKIIIDEDATKTLVSHFS
ncbi:MAG: genetic competence negative regulator [Vulcanibacillus sp.]